ncbi:hypothetical protein X975_01281, partial [Stegodyphus mimosarum]
EQLKLVILIMVNLKKILLKLFQEKVGLYVRKLGVDIFYIIKMSYNLNFKTMHYM